MSVIDEISHKETLHKAFGLLWPLTWGEYDYFFYENPFCGRCKVRVVDGTVHSYKCTECDKVYEFDRPTDQIRGQVWRLYEGKVASGYKVESLELLPTNVSAEDRDGNYWVKVKLGEKDGKRIGVVYFGEINKDVPQSQKDYTQMFVDLEEDQVRFDKSNKNPLQLLSRVTVEFPGTVVGVEKK